MPSVNPHDENMSEKLYFGHELIQEPTPPPTRGIRFRTGNEIIQFANAKVHDLQTELVEIRAALAFYADENNYVSKFERLSCGCCSTGGEIPIDVDRGERARNVLGRVK